MCMEGSGAGRKEAWAEGGGSNLRQGMSLGAPQKRSRASCWPPLISHPDPLCQKAFAKEQMFYPPLSRCPTPLFIHLFVRSFIHAFIYSSNHPLIFFIHLFIHPLICPLIHLPTHLFICPPIRVPILSFICLFIHSFIHLPDC